MHNIYHIVEFDKYCDLCEYSELPEDKEPCSECIATSVVQNSHKPAYFKEKR